MIIGNGCLLSTSWGPIYFFIHYDKHLVSIYEELIFTEAPLRTMNDCLPNYWTRRNTACRRCSEFGYLVNLILSSSCNLMTVAGGRTNLRQHSVLLRATCSILARNSDYDVENVYRLQTRPSFASDRGSGLDYVFSCIIWF